MIRHAFIMLLAPPLYYEYWTWEKHWYLENWSALLVLFRLITTWSLFHWAEKIKRNSGQIICNKVHLLKMFPNPICLVLGCYQFNRIKSLTRQALEKQNIITSRMIKKINFTPYSKTLPDFSVSSSVERKGSVLLPIEKSGTLSLSFEPTSPLNFRYLQVVVG